MKLIFKFLKKSKQLLRACLNKICTIYSILSTRSQLGCIKFRETDI